MLCREIGSSRTEEASKDQEIGYSYISIYIDIVLYIETMNTLGFSVNLLGTMLSFR